MNNPKCPYCGAEMRVKNMYETVAFACSCGAMSPVKDTKEEALAAALRKTLQRPLTFSEISDMPVVFLEDIDKEDTLRALPLPLPHHDRDCVIGFLTVEQASFAAYQSDYGKRWRAWKSQPTEDEREAAKWEATVNE